ncbi:MAG TPA: Dyp-type peroxidase [Actinospica sp.]|nr:Dyp-type peroxidase [Actinospica sp.]
MAEVTRRKLFAVTGAVGAGGIAAGAVLPRPTSAAPRTADDQRLEFYGAHQPGISAPVQAQGWLTAFDLKPGTTIDQVRALMRDWTSIAATTMEGDPLPGDDAMTYGRGPGSLTVTVGVGASLLTKLGLGHRIPEALTPLPTFLGDAIEASASDGDLVVLVAANDGLVAVHALRALQRAAASVATQRWQISGFGEAGGVMPSPTATPRNLMGQLDGTGNPVPGTAAFDRTVYVPADGGPTWMRGGSYLVYRRIRMLLNDWDTLDRARQEAVIGRDKPAGAPLSGGTESTAPDYEKLSASGSLMIPPGSHIRQASAQFNSGATIFRRPFSYYGGQRADGSPDAGLVFLAFQQDPATGFTVIQQRLSGADTLSTYIRHEASGLFAILPGCAEGGYLGQGLWEGG